MPDFNPESRPSASGLLKDLKDTFAGLTNSKWLSEKKPAQQEEVVVPAPVPTEEAVPDWLTPTLPDTDLVDQITIAQSSADTITHPLAAPTVVGLQLPEQPVVEENGIPDWLKVPPPLRDSELKTLGPSDFLPLDKVSVDPIVPKSEEEKVEVDPFAANKEFNGYMETIRQAQEALASGTALTPDQEKQAKIAAAKANSLLPKLPSDVLRSVILMRAVASNNPKFSRNDFQKEMLGVIDIIRGGVASKA